MTDGRRAAIAARILARLDQILERLARLEDCVGDVADTVDALDRYNRPCGDGTKLNPPRRRMRR